MALESHSTPEGKSFYTPAGKSPDRYINMNPKDRDRVYTSLRESLAGDLSAFRPQDNLSNSIWKEVADPKLSYGLDKPASALKGMPVSQAILDAMNQEKDAGGLGGRDPKSVMYYCLNYLQSQMTDRDNIDKVGKGDRVKIYEEGGRWKLQVINSDKSIQLEGFLFPPFPGGQDEPAEEPEETTAAPEAATETSGAPLETTAAALETTASPEVIEEDDEGGDESAESGSATTPETTAAAGETSSAAETIASGETSSAAETIASGETSSAAETIASGETSSAAETLPSSETTASAETTAAAGETSSAAETIASGETSSPAETLPSSETTASAETTAAAGETSSPAETLPSSETTASAETTAAAGETSSPAETLTPSETSAAPETVAPTSLDQLNAKLIERYGRAPNFLPKVLTDEHGNPTLIAEPDNFETSLDGFDPSLKTEFKTLKEFNLGLSLAIKFRIALSTDDHIGLPYPLDASRVRNINTAYDASCRVMDVIAKLPPKATLTNSPFYKLFSADEKKFIDDLYDPNSVFVSSSTAIRAFLKNIVQPPETPSAAETVPPGLTVFEATADAIPLDSLLTEDRGLALQVLADGDLLTRHMPIRDNDTLSVLHTHLMDETLYPTIDPNLLSIVNRLQEFRKKDLELHTLQIGADNYLDAVRSGVTPPDDAEDLKISLARMEQLAKDLFGPFSRYAILASHSELLHPNSIQYIKQQDVFAKATQSKQAILDRLNTASV